MCVLDRQLCSILPIADTVLLRVYSSQLQYQILLRNGQQLPAQIDLLLDAFGSRSTVSLSVMLSFSGMIVLFTLEAETLN